MVYCKDIITNDSFLLSKISKLALNRIDIFMRFIYTILILTVFVSCHNGKQKAQTQSIDSLLLKLEFANTDSLIIYGNDYIQEIDTILPGRFDGVWVNLEFKELVTQFRSLGQAAEHYKNTDTFIITLAISHDRAEGRYPEAGDYNVGNLQDTVFSLDDPIDNNLYITQITCDTICINRGYQSKIFVKIDIDNSRNYNTRKGLNYLGSFMMHGKNFEFLNQGAIMGHKIAFNKDFSITGFQPYTKYSFYTDFGVTLLELEENNNEDGRLFRIDEYEKGYVLNGVALWNYNDLTYSNTRCYLAKQAPDGSFYKCDDIKDTDDIELVKSFLTWYKNNYDRIWEIGIINMAHDEPDQFYSVNIHECHKFINMFRESGYVSEIFLDDWLDYFTKYEQFYKDNAVNDGPPDGFDFDLILLTQETDDALHTIPYKMKIEEVRYKDDDHSSVKVNLRSISLIFVLSKSGDGKWQLNGILNGCCDDDWK